VGPLSSTFVIDSAGMVAAVEAAGLEARRRTGGIMEAFQSYPTILRGDGEVPEQLRAPGRGVSVSHRDARFALGLLRDGRVLLTLTRFDLLGGALSELPLGPTVPEMAAIMGALGCAQAMLLDGGSRGRCASPVQARGRATAACPSRCSCTHVQTAHAAQRANSAGVCSTLGSNAHDSTRRLSCTRPPVTIIVRRSYCAIVMKAERIPARRERFVRMVTDHRSTVAA
jgi:hypothetical protein